jgi:UDP-2-acetamido-3-amino-2,3-dideoxy-glucuronate N-acetyltransferase
MMDYYVHPTAIVDTKDIGKGTKIWAFCHIMDGVNIGDNCNIGDNTFMESGVAVGNNVTIKNGNMLWEGVTLEDGVFVGPGVFFTNDRHPRSPRLPEASHRYKDHSWLSPVLVKQGAAIGAGSVILPGITIGEYATIGAGAVVTKDVIAYAVVAGNPARQKGWVCRCGMPLAFIEGMSQCVCGRKYSLQNEKVQLA